MLPPKDELTLDLPWLEVPPCERYGLPYAVLLAAVDVHAYVPLLLQRVYGYRLICQ